LIVSSRFDAALCRASNPSIFVDGSTAALQQKLMRFKTPLAELIFRAFCALYYTR